MWPSCRGMGGGYVAVQGDGYLSLGRRVAKLVAHLLDTAALWVRRHLSKYKMGDVSKGVANTL